MPTAIVIVPLAAAVACALPYVSRAARPIGVIAGLAVTVLAALSLALNGTVDMRTTWATDLGAGYAVDLDALSATFLMLVGLVFAIGAAASARVASRREYFALWDLLLASLAGLFVARDLLLFVICWDACLIPLVVVIWQWGSGRERRSAATRLLVYELGGSALLLVAILSLAVARGTLDFDGLAARRVPPSGQLLPALLALGAFAVRLGLFPLHGWLPRAYAAAPVPVAMALCGGLAASAAYGIVRVDLTLFPQGMSAAAPVLVALAAVGVLYGAVVATRQDDLRRLIAFANLSQLNLVALALFAATATSLRGAVLASISNGLVIATALLLAAMLARRTSSFALSRAGGLVASTPILAALFGATTLAMIGLPGTSAFAGDVVALAGSYERFPAATATAALGLIAAAAYGLGAMRRAFQGPPLATGMDLRRRERALVAPLLTLIVLLGIAPGLLSDRIPDDALPALEVGR
jgi:NADH-quinone oxidoreductase subunit M